MLIVWELTVIWKSAVEVRLGDIRNRFVKGLIANSSISSMSSFLIRITTGVVLLVHNLLSTMGITLSEVCVVPFSILSRALLSLLALKSNGETTACGIFCSICGRVLSVVFGSFVLNSVVPEVVGKSMTSSNLVLPSFPRDLDLMYLLSECCFRRSVVGGRPGDPNPQEFPTH